MGTEHIHDKARDNTWQEHYIARQEKYHDKAWAEAIQKQSLRSNNLRLGHWRVHHRLHVGREERYEVVPGGVRQLRVAL